MKVSLPYDTWLMFFNHSKNDTVTPPALMYKSGITKIFFSNRIESAAGVVGPLAASAMICNARLLNERYDCGTTNLGSDLVRVLFVDDFLGGCRH